MRRHHRLACFFMMFRRVWSPILAACGVVAILSVAVDARPVWKHLVQPPIQRRAPDAAPLPAPAPEPQSQAAPAPQQPTSEPAPPPIISITIEGSRDEASGQQRDQAAEERDKRDLRAQESIADSAESMAAIAWWLLGVGLLALVGLCVAVYFTRKSTKAAIVATGAAVATAKTADDTFKSTKLAMEASDRAYVHHNGVSYVSHAETGTGRIFWRLRPSWTNTGNTPTRQMKVFVAYEFIDALLPDDYTFPTPSFDTVPGTSIGPKGSIESDARDFWGEDLVAVKEGRKHLYIWGVAVYRDVFPDTPHHVTKFCVRATGDIVGDPLIELGDANKLEVPLTFHTRHNCQDEDCA
jgi:hypothetical protein